MIHKQHTTLRNSWTANGIPIHDRIEILKTINNLITQNISLICDALYKDFGGSEFDHKLKLLGIVKETGYHIKNVVKWSNKTNALESNLMTDVFNSMLGFVSPQSFYMVPRPRGCVLIIGAWNYPITLTLLPTIA